ncbi:FecCD family ABC transporter permease [Leucobacter luti]|uniref:FecCD family ABC transporter permease n=1 Tax=Leucobacter luti TaxID=340320 RepID=UPI003D033AE7
MTATLPRSRRGEAAAQACAPSVRRTLRIGAIVLPLRIRPLAWTSALLALAAVLFAVSISVGDVPVPLERVLGVLLGAGEPGDAFIVGELRLPRAIVAAGAGGALGMAGALIQNVTRNPLASPDVLGILSGASAGAVAAIVLGIGAAASPFAGWGLPPFALAGGSVAAATVFLLSGNREASSMRLILIGVGVAAVSSALTSLLMVGARVHEASQAVVWLTGTLDGRTWSHARPLLVALAIVPPLLLPLLHALGALGLGDALARSIGVRAGAVRLAALVLATVLAATAVAAAGPIAFVAFVAPQIMMRVIGAHAPPVIGGGVCGAVLLLGTDVATRLFLPVGLPVGIVTVALGAPFFLALILTRQRRFTA